MSASRASASFTSLSSDLKSGARSPVDLVDDMLVRIAEHDGGLHAYAHVASAAARAEAERAVVEIREGRWLGPLHGVPIAVKDVFNTTDMPTRFGSPVYDGFEAPFESTATARLRASGAILLGKLTLTEGVYADHHPSVTPPVNPFGAAHWTGTSSSGSGVAVTAALAYAALGTDTGGSIRLPSACCGLVGIKPTWGRVSRHGVFELAESLDHVGPMARSVADAAAMLAAIAGPDPADPTAALVPVPDYVEAANTGTVRGSVVGIDWTFLRSRSDETVLASIAAVVEVLAKLDAVIVDVGFPDPQAILEGWAVQCAVEAALAHRQTFPARRDEYGPRMAGLLDRGAAHTAADLALALRDRRAFNGRMATLFDGIDLLLVPGLPVAGPSLAHMATLGEDPAGILAIGPFTAPFDVCGYPTISLPCGASREGIPIGCQLVARPFEEDRLCRAGAAFQGVTDWHERRPTL